MDTPNEITLTGANVGEWPKFKRMLEEGKLAIDRKGRLRYRHGAPVGILILTRTKGDSTPTYKESAKEWFDPESQTAREFVWP